MTWEEIFWPFGGMIFMVPAGMLYESGRRTPKRLKTGVPIYTPTMLGPKYVIRQRNPKAPPTGAHYTLLKRRAGHLRRTHIGVGRKDVKIALIDPYIAYSAGRRQNR
jgi:hypothetical protein